MSFKACNSVSLIVIRAGTGSLDLISTVIAQHALSHNSVITHRVDPMVVYPTVFRCLPCQTLLIAVRTASNVTDSEVDRHTHEECEEA